MRAMELSTCIAREKENLLKLMPAVEKTITTADMGFAREILAGKGFTLSDLNFGWAIAMIWRLGVIAGIRAERKRRHHTNE